jgi:DNA-binding response OmpR family regulator
VVEQDAELARLIEDIVADAGLEVRIASDADEAQALIASGVIALLIVGVSLSDVRDRAKRSGEVPAIVMTEFGNAVPFLRAGDEVLTKPFRAGDLVARITRMARRTGVARVAV